MQKGLSKAAGSRYSVVFFFLWDSIQDEEGNNFLIINDFAQIQIPTRWRLGKT